MARLTPVSESSDNLTARTAMPQRIGPEPTAHQPPKKRRKTLKRFFIAIVLLGLLAAVVVGGVFAFDALRGPTEDERVESAIETYMSAVKAGELDDLRATTCGEAREYYDGLSTTEFMAVYDASRDSIPIIDDIERVEITGTRAIAEVTAHTRAHAEETVRTVGLERVGGEWKVCDAADRSRERVAAGTVQRIRKR